MNQKLVKWVSAAFAGILLFMYIQLFVSRRMVNGAGDGKAPTYHMQIICEDLDTVFFTEFALGAKQAQADFDLYVELVEADKWEVNRIPLAVLGGIYAGVDGVAFQTDDTESILEMLAASEPYGTVLMLYESDNDGEAPILTAGTDPYQIGYDAGMLALEAANGPCRAALVIDSTQYGAESTEGSRKLQGVLDAFAGADGAELVEVYPLSNEVMSGEVLVNTILDARDSFDTIICLNEKTTTLIGQRLLHNGLFREVNMIGYGSLEQTLDCINRGIIYASVCPDAYDVGYQTVALMYAALAGEETSSYFSRNHYVISRRNILDFLLDAEEAL